MKYYIGRILVSGMAPHAFSSDACIAAKNREQARQLLDSRAALWGGDDSRQVEEGVYEYQDSIENVTFRARVDKLTEVSPSTFAEMKSVFPFFGDVSQLDLDKQSVPDRVKTLTHNLGTQLKKQGTPVAHAKLMDAVAASLGKTNWRVAAAGEASLDAPTGADDSLSKPILWWCECPDDQLDDYLPEERDYTTEDEDDAQERLDSGWRVVALYPRAQRPVEVPLRLRNHTKHVGKQVRLVKKLVMAGLQEIGKTDQLPALEEALKRLQELALLPDSAVSGLEGTEAGEQLLSRLTRRDVLVSIDGTPYEVEQLRWEPGMHSQLIRLFRDSRMHHLAVPEEVWLTRKSFKDAIALEDDHYEIVDEDDETRIICVAIAEFTS